MAYSQDMRVAARRHLRAAIVLHDHAAPGAQPGCLAVAGYLFGIAGELAVKQLMSDSGIRPLSPTNRRDDPFYAHFPVLKTMLMTAPGRRAGELRQVSENPQLFQNWDTTMRYAPTTEIEAGRVTAWRISAEELIRKMDIR
jgi:hypothetical protein